MNWKCKCGKENKMNKEHCVKCFKPNLNYKPEVMKFNCHGCGKLVTTRTKHTYEDCKAYKKIGEVKLK